MFELTFIIISFCLNIFWKMDFDKLPSDFTYLLIDKKKDFLEFRIKEVNDDVSAKNWITRMSEESKTTWRVERTHPETKGKYNVFKLDMRCQHRTDSRAKGISHSKNTNCPASFRILVKRYIPKSRSKSPDLLTKDWPTVCTFKKDHNHGIETAAVLKCRDLSEASKETLKLLFRKGHNPSSALHCLKTDLLLEHGEEFYKIDADGYYVPSLSVVSKLFQKEFTDIYGGMTGPEMFKVLQKLLADYTSASSGKAEFHRTEDGQYYFVVILTPIMLRVHEHIVQSKELILIDASGGVDKQRHRIYFFVCPTSAGGLPAGVIISNTEKESVFYEALVCYKSMLGNVAFFGETFPKVFLTDNDLKERKPLAKLFPQSKLLLCQFHFLKSVWSWLCNKHNSVKDTERQELYFFVKNMVYANNEEEFFKCKEEMVSSDVFKNNKNFWQYFDFLWSQKSDWALCYRKHLPVRGNNTTNYVEVVFRIIKDNILNRVMAFNINQLVDFILTRYEMYMQKRLIDFVNGRLSKSLLYKMQPVENDIPNEDIHPNGNYLFTVRNQNKDHLVDLLNGVCSCSTGQSGKICKHASAVIMHSTNEIITAYNLACPSMKQKIFLVATGNSVPPDWLMPLNQQPAVDTMEFSETKKNLQPSRNSNMEEMSTASTSDALNYTPENETSSADDLVEFDALVARMKEGYQNEPDVFVPAMKKMLKNARTNATTQTGLVSAMHTFGLYSGAGRRINRERHHGQRIGVQPTSINRRKILLAGKRKLSAGRPVQSAKVSKELQSHDYTSFGRLPSRKLKATHNLQDCVYNNKSLGGRK